MSMESPAEAPTESTARESPWQGGVRELVRGFLVLRDLFSYALPGATSRVLPASVHDSA
jgi:hypothetical protein